MNSIPSREEAIFKAALELGTADERAELLDRECGDDVALRAEVESLLAAMDDAGTQFLGAPAVISASAATILYQRGEGSLPPSSSRSMFSGSVSLPPGSYTVGDEIAHGGMGTVLEVEDRELGRKVAMKVMRLEASASEQARARFVREATVLARLEHPNIVPIHELGRDEEGRLYYTMKLVIGRTLQAIIKGLHVRDPHYIEHYTLDRLLTIFRKVCDALAFAHAKGVLHRDLKPENIMVGEFGEVLVMDWGLAKILHEEEGADATHPVIDLQHSTFLTDEERLAQTMAGSVMGTPQYMSPEQARGETETLDERSDIYSLGGILYALLTLRPPVEGKTLDEVLEKVRTGEVVSPSHFGATAPSGKKSVKGEVLEAKKIKPLPHIESGRVPAALSSVVMKALTLDKAARYQSVPDFAADIEKYQTGFATTAEEAGLFTQLRLLVQRHRREFAVGFAAWLIITALGVWFVINLRAKEQRATQAEAVAVQEKETTRQALAKSQLDLAEKEFERGKFVEAQKILEETPESFRDANWRFLRAHSRDFTAQLSIPGKGIVRRLQFLPQGDRFAARFYADVIGTFTLAGRQVGDWIPTKDKWGSCSSDSAGAKLAFAATGNEVVVQDAASGTILRRWICDVGEIKHVLLSPDGETLLAGGSKQLIAYAAETGAPRWTHPSTDAIPAFSPDGRTVAVLASKTGLDFKIQLLDTASGAMHRTIEATSDKPISKGSLQFNQAGDQLACLGGDEVILWDVKTGRKERALHFPGETVALLSPRGDAVATFNGYRIRLWDTTTGRLLRSLDGASTNVVVPAFSSDGKMLLSSHDSTTDGIVTCWPIRLGEEIAAVRAGTSRARRVLFDRDGSKFYGCASSGAGAWDTRTSLQRWSFSKTGVTYNHLAIHPIDGTIVLSESGTQAIPRFTAAGEALEAFRIRDNEASLWFSRTGRLLLTVDNAFDPSNPGRAFSVVEYPAGKVLRKISFEKGGQPYATFCLDDAAVATAAKVGGITVWDWQAGTPLHQIDAAQTGSIACLASSPDSRHLASGGPDRWIRIWEAATGRLEAAFRAHWEGVRCVKFSPDGREILSGSEDGVVRLHDAATGEERLALYGLTEKVADADISADGKLIAAISTDGFMKVWDRQLSSAAALLPQGVTANEPVVAARPPVENTPPALSKPAVPKDAEGWEDLLARLTPAEVEKSGSGWSLKDGGLFSPNTKWAMLPLPGELSGTSYRVRVKLRQLAAMEVFHVVLPVADRMCGFELEGRPSGGIYTGLIQVNGKWGKDLPGIVEGKQVNDTEPHDLEVTVRLGGANATITTTLDTRPLYEWTGPTAALSRHSGWATTEPGALALGTYAGGWAVSEVKVKRLEAGN